MNHDIKRNDFRALIPKDKCFLCEITAEETNPEFIEVVHNNTDETNNDVSNLLAICEYCEKIKSKYESVRNSQSFWLLYLGTKELPNIKKALKEMSFKYFNGEINFQIKSVAAIFKKYDSKFAYLSRENKVFLELKREIFLNVLHKNRKHKVKKSKTSPEKLKTHQELKNEVHEKIMKGLKDL